MPLIRQQHITRRDLQLNRHVLYLFGDNCERRGRGGQAAATRGEPNAVGRPLALVVIVAFSAGASDCEGAAAVAIHASSRAASERRSVYVPIQGHRGRRARMQQPFEHGHALCLEDKVAREWFWELRPRRFTMRKSGSAHLC